MYHANNTNQKKLREAVFISDRFQSKESDQGYKVGALQEKVSSSLRHNNP